MVFRCNMLMQYLQLPSHLNSKAASNNKKVSCLLLQGTWICTYISIAWNHTEDLFAGANHSVAASSQYVISTGLEKTRKVPTLCTYFSSKQTNSTITKTKPKLKSNGTQCWQWSYKSNAPCKHGCGSVSWRSLHWQSENRRRNLAHILFVGIDTNQVWTLHIASKKACLVYFLLLCYLTCPCWQTKAM